MTVPFQLCLEGWRGLPHSYAVANQFLCLELLRRPEVRLRFRDTPYFSPAWQRIYGLFTPAQEAALYAIPAPHLGESCETILRMDYPHRFQPSPGSHLAVFMTSEFHMVPDHAIADGPSLAEAHRRSDALLITCSDWARRGLLHSGADPARVVVVPLGYDPELFHPATESARASLRTRLQVDGFWFLNLGAMTGNKRIPLLLKAFAAVAARHPQARLALKGVDDLYSSRSLAESAGAALTPAEAALIQPRLRYFGATFSFQQVADLYQAVDAYVTPYAAEGFNLPALEAAASGLPVICTAGGPTDEFTHPDFALYVAATLTPFQDEGSSGFTLIPSLESLTAHMLAVIEQPEIAKRARMAGPRFVAQGFRWSQVVDRLLAILAPR